MPVTVTFDIVENPISQNYDVVGKLRRCRCQGSRCQLDLEVCNFASGICRSWIFVVYTWNMTTCATSQTYFDIYLVYDTPCHMSDMSGIYFPSHLVICLVYVWDILSEPVYVYIISIIIYYFYILFLLLFFFKTLYMTEIPNILNSHISYLWYAINMTHKYYIHKP